MKTSTSLVTTYKETYKVNSININTNKKLGLFGLLQILQDAASEHASKLGFGYENAIKKGFFWVLTRQKLQMDAWPQLEDTITIKTWTKPVEDIIAIREYEIFVNSKKIGACATSWMILDTKTRRPKKIENAESLFMPRKDYSLNFLPEKINLPEKIEAINTLEVKISDLDINKHVNNVKYTQWVLDAIPFPYHKSFMIQEYEINFSAETFLKDHIELQSNLNQLEPQTANELFFKGKRLTDNKTVFTTRMLTKKIA